MITYQTEQGMPIWDEIGALLPGNWEEMGHYRDIPLDPDREVYRVLEQTGALRCYTVRETNDLVGYLTVVVSLALHHKGSLQAMQDVLFLLPAYRRGRIGVKLLQWAEGELSAEGVQVLYFQVMRGSVAARLLPCLGYEHLGEYHAKRLDRSGQCLQQ